jgi:hypothetical protein
MAPINNFEELFPAPSWVSVAEFKEGCDDLGIGLIRGTVGFSRYLLETAGSALHVAIDPLVGSLSGDVILQAKISDRFKLTQNI